MGQIPGTPELRWYERAWIVEALAVVPPMIAASVSAWVNLHAPVRETQTLGWILSFGIVWLLVASGVKVLNAYTREQRSVPRYDGLQAALQVLYAAVSGSCGITPQDGGRLRITILRVVPPAEPNGPTEELEQVLAYVGGSGKGPGRRFSVRSGITGRAVREQAAFAASRRHDEYADFLRELVTTWGYTSVDARQLTEDRQAWMAVPIMGPRGVVAVVYLDSDEREFFTPEVQALVIHGCRGVAAYVDAT